MSNHNIKDFIDKLKINNQNPYDINLNDIDLDPHNLGDYVSKQMQDIQYNIGKIPHKEEDKPKNRLEKFMRSNTGLYLLVAIIIALIGVLSGVLFGYLSYIKK